MWGVALILFSLVRVQVMAREIKMECKKFGLPPSNSASPSQLVGLKVQLVPEGVDYALNISWAVSIDASITHLKGTNIVVSGKSYICEYKPHLAEVTGQNQIWFHYLVAVSEGFTRVQAANLPLPPLGSGLSYISQTVMVPPPEESAAATTASTVPPPIDVQNSRVWNGSKPRETPSSSKTAMTHERVTVLCFGALAGLMILSACYIIYKSCGANIATSFGFKSLPQSPAVPVHVLLVYPAENSAFQGAVAALAEFLRHGGCSVAIDMWQQGKIAELGPMRWLAEQVRATDQVLIVCPQPSSEPCHSPPNSLLQPSIPAAAHDLYPLILNMVASHAKSASDLARFWVVQLSKKQDKRPSNLAPELRACKTFCLMKDLSKLCKSLHTHRKDDKKKSDLIFRPGISYSEKSTMKLREAVEKHFKRGGSAESGHISLNICNENV